MKDFVFLLAGRNRPACVAVEARIDAAARESFISLAGCFSRGKKEMTGAALWRVCGICSAN